MAGKHCFTPLLKLLRNIMNCVNIQAMSIVAGFYFLNCVINFRVKKLIKSYTIFIKRSFSCFKPMNSEQNLKNSHFKHYL